MLAFAEFKAKAAEGVGLTCRVVILVPAFGPATMGPCVATVVVPLASPLDGARRARILSGNIIGQPSSRDSATFRLVAHAVKLPWKIATLRAGLKNLNETISGVSA